MLSIKNKKIYITGYDSSYKSGTNGTDKPTINKENKMIFLLYIVLILANIPFWPRTQNVFTTGFIAGMFVAVLAYRYFDWKYNR